MNDLYGFYQVGEKLQPKAINIAPKLDIDKKKATPLSSSRQIKEVAKNIVIKTIEKSKVSSGVKDGKCYHNGFKGGFAQQLIQYACDVSNSDPDFILTLNAEMGSWNWKGQSNVIKNGKRERSYGMCQVMWDYHKNTIYEGLPANRVFESRYLTDWKYQIDTCYSLYKGGTKMYGYNVRHKVLKGLIYINGKKY